MTTLVDAWSQIAVEGRTEPGWHARRVRGGSGCDIRAAIRAPDRAEAVLFEVASRSWPPGADAPDCLGFELLIETIQPGPNGRIRLCLLLRDRRYRDVFATLAADVVGVVSTADTEVKAVKLLLGRLNTWERFISRFGPDRLSEERQTGLFAELAFLRDEVVPALAASSAVRCWRGPYLEPHDFRFRAAAVEVKATTSRNPASIPISNLDQLDVGPEGVLYLVHARIEIDAIAGVTLPALIFDLKGALAATDPGAASELDRSLIEAGYLDIHAPHYDRVFDIRESIWFDVGDDFPRLTRGLVPVGVTAAAYSVAVDACMPFALPQDEARRSFRTRL